MSSEQHVWPYWSVDLPGLTEANARRILALVEQEGMAVGAVAADPADTFSIHMDRETAAALVIALGAALSTGALPSEEMQVVRGFVDQITNWMPDA